LLAPYLISTILHKWQHNGIILNSVANLECCATFEESHENESVYSIKFNYKSTENHELGPDGSGRGQFSVILTTPAKN
jgi:hypothetical protein